MVPIPTDGNLLSSIQSGDPILPILIGRDESQFACNARSWRSGFAQQGNNRRCRIAYRHGAGKLSRHISGGIRGIIGHGVDSGSIGVHGVATNHDRNARITSIRRTRPLLGIGVNGAFQGDSRVPIESDDWRRCIIHGERGRAAIRLTTRICDSQCHNVDTQTKRPTRGDTKSQGIAVRIRGTPIKIHCRD